MSNQHDQGGGTAVPGTGPVGPAVASTPARSSTAVSASAEPDGTGDRILTIPNVISFARLLGVPVFLWLVLGVQSRTGDWWAVGLLLAAGSSSCPSRLCWFIARAIFPSSQSEKPAADRLYIVATIVALAVRAIIPWWLVGVLAARELVLAVVLVVLRRRGWGPLQVSFAGKAATLCLLYAFPLLFLGDHAASYAEVTRIIGWTFVIWGSALYWWAAGLYIAQARQLLAETRPRPVT
jgi:cardiolipin synthase